MSVVEGEIVQDGEMVRMRKRKVLFDAQKETQRYFGELLSRSVARFDDDARTRLQILRKDSENKVYAKLQDSTCDYLLILFKDRSTKIQKDAYFLKEKLLLKEKEVMKNLNDQNISIQSKVKSIQTIKRELEEKLEVMRTKNPENHILEETVEALKKKEELKYQNYLEFRRQSYWKIPNERKNQSLQFLQSIQKEQKKARERYQSLEQLSKQKKIQRQSHQKLQKIEKHNKQRVEVHERYKEYKFQREKELQEEAKKQKQTEQFLAKYKARSPAHIIFVEKAKKQSQLEEKRMKHILSELKQQKKHCSLSQINERLKDYEDYKQRHAQQLEQKRMLELQEEQLAKSRLNRLYKSKVRAYSAQKEVKLPDEKQVRHEKTMKMVMYSQKVKQSYKPKVDPEKREQLLQSIEDTIRKQHKIQKSKDGELILLDKNDFNSRQIGLKYLEQVKQMTSLIERKVPTPPAEEGIKIVDRSLMKNTFYNKHITITNWKAIIDDQKLNEVQKQARLQDYFNLIEQEQIKSTQSKKKASLSRSIDLQRKTDHYELQKAAAKLAFLKSMI